MEQLNTTFYSRLTLTCAVKSHRLSKGALTVQCVDEITLKCGHVCKMSISKTGIVKKLKKRMHFYDKNPKICELSWSPRVSCSILHCHNSV